MSQQRSLVSRWRLAALAGAFSLTGAAAYAQHMGPDAGAKSSDNAGAIELVDPKVLRVCADPNNLPFSNEKGEGFENKIAELLARKLGKDLAYRFYPGATGFVRNTLNAHLCDVIIGIPQGNDLVQSTNPYYRTTYAILTRAGSDLDGIRNLDDPRLKEKKGRIGLVANTPPGNILAKNGMIGLVKPYALMIDTRVEFLERGDGSRSRDGRHRRRAPLGTDRRLLRQEIEREAQRRSDRRNARNAHGVPHRLRRTPFRSELEARPQ